ncbi:MAG: thioredoxin domain-containing protein, partial [Desulfobacteraceae bacterium]
HSANHWANQWGITEGVFQTQWEAVRQKLFQARKKRVPPLKDDKILTDWNGLMIAAFAMGARVLNRSEYETMAVKAADFIWENLKTQEGRLLHRFRDGQAAIDGTATDYAYYIMGLLELYRTTFQVANLERAIVLQERMIEDFWNESSGGFYLTARQSSDLPIRPMEIYDGAIPSANSVGLGNLIQLSRLTGTVKWEDMAHKMLQAFGEKINDYPPAYTYFLMGVGYTLGRSCQVVLVGDPNEQDTQLLLNSLNQNFRPGMGVVLKTDENKGSLAELAQFTNALRRENQKPTAYVCKGLHCDRPTTDMAEMIALIQKRNF